MRSDALAGGLEDGLRPCPAGEELLQLAVARKRRQAAAFCGSDDARCDVVRIRDFTQTLDVDSHGRGACHRIDCERARMRRIEVQPVAAIRSGDTRLSKWAR
jgi:hypothetical protein